MDGSKLRYWRLVRGMTQRELAARAGSTHAAVSEIELGKRQPRPALIVRLADALEIDPRELIPEISETGKAAA